MMYDVHMDLCVEVVMGLDGNTNLPRGEADKTIRIVNRKGGAFRKPQSKVFGLVAGCVVVIGGLAFLFLANTPEPEPEIVNTTKPKSTPIVTEWEPQTNKAVVVTAPEPAPPEEEEYIEVNGQKIKLAADPKTGKPKYDKNVRIIPMRASDIRPRRFEHDAEELIAATLEIEPGTLMYGEIPFGKRFNDSLAKSFMTPVEIKPTDDEYTVELKKQVQQVKDEFKELLLNGGDPAAEMKKAREELIRLGQYRNTLVQELNRLRKSGQYTSRDMKDYLEAANQMMAEKGLKPITMPAVILRNMELNERKNQQ